ncbi:XRE family transcriptional regulator [Rhodococcus rhodochrous]|nr:XRE family transcriptional regulator [Rhodococcus rhodochrous]
MDNRSEIREFLATRRARITPQQAGLPAFGGKRRVPGLRREEVAMLAGVSVDYYTRLERGDLGGASDSVLDALAGALQLDEAERAHLYDLARAVESRDPRRRRSAPRRVSPSVRRVLDVVMAPAWVRNGRADVVATNTLGRALYWPLFDGSTKRPNTARFTFLDPRAVDFYGDWERTASDMVAVLRAEAGRTPNDRELTALIGELSTRSQEFRTRWAAHNVLFHRTGRKSLHHPVVGDLDLTYEALDLTSSPGLTLLVYTAEPDSATQESLDLLASWAATSLREERGRSQPEPDVSS